MTHLSQQRCTACHADAERPSAQELATWLAELPQWQVIQEQDIPQLEQTYRFPDFLTALAFTQAVGQAAEATGHHPCLITEWGLVTVRWWTHAIRGLHRNDFIMAAKTDELYKDA